MSSTKDFIKGAFLGLATGDALGVPVEFLARKNLTAFPVAGMREFGSHRQPAGTWSDDSSLTFCLAEMLCQGYDLQDLANRFINWRTWGYWTAHGSVFDVGIATAQAIEQLARKGDPTLAGGADEGSNGNGSLMRILPLAFYLKDKPVEERFHIVQEVSSLTHRHIRSVTACFIYCEMALQLMATGNKETAFRNMQQSAGNFLQSGYTITREELDFFQRILELAESKSPARPLREATEPEIMSGGYVLDTIEAALWCLLQTDNYKDAVLLAVNLGDDADTTGAVTGGLAGLLYGAEAIPADWLAVLAKRAEIEELAGRLAGVLG